MNMTDPELVNHYKMTLPSGKDSYIQKDRLDIFPENTPILFPFVMIVHGLTCDDLKITSNAIDYSTKPNI